jgi:hypothetical protein
MVLYALCLHPLLRSLEENLPRIPVRQCQQQGPVIAYADDVTVFVSQPEAFITIHQSICRFELATGARLNPTKSKALAIGTRSDPATVLSIEFHECVNILGVTFGPTIVLSIKDSWTGVICAVRAQARKAYRRNLCLTQCLHYVQLCLLAKIWYVAQILPLNCLHAQQLTTICSWFIWQGAIFCVPITTLQRPKYEGGWDFPNVEVKCKTLLYNQLHMLAALHSSATSELMRHWDLTSLLPNPSFAHWIPSKLVHLRQYSIDMAYVTTHAPNETCKEFKWWTYGVLLCMDKNARPPSNLWILQKFPGTDWDRV